MNIKEVLEEEISLIKIENSEKKELDKIAKKSVEEIEKRIKKRGIKASVFIGGSLAKGTMLNKTKQDIDLFLRFDEKYSDNDIKKLMRKIFFLFRINGLKLKLKKMHGSRDYVRIDIIGKVPVAVEVVPSTKISKPEEARNVTDLSYFHVNYVKDKIKQNKRLSDEIIIAKAFCHAQGVYGAESYVNGFSGYALELLIINYGSFENFLKEVVHSREQIIVDLTKESYNKKEIINELNPSKRNSPIILIDPTFRERNTTASLSEETFQKFKKAAARFIEAPDIKFFKNEKIYEKEIMEYAKKRGFIGLIVELKTKKQAGDIAGTKLLKFSKVLSKEIAKNTDILGEYFEYDEKKKAKVYFILKRKNEIVMKGPLISNKPAVEGFKKEHPIWYVDEESKRICAAKSPHVNINKMINEFNKKDKKMIRQMSIVKMKVVKVEE